MIDDENDISTATASATIWSAQWLKFFTVNRDATISTASGRNIKLSAIDESCHLNSPLLSFHLATHL
jgi:fructosamine-3-kinase